MSSTIFRSFVPDPEITHKPFKPSFIRKKVALYCISPLARKLDGLVYFLLYNKRIL